MKKKILYLLTICMCGWMSMFGQPDNAKVIKQLEATPADYIPLLNNSGFEAFPFDISSLSDGLYYLNFKVKEYKDGKEITDDIMGGYGTFPNMHLISEFPEEDQKSIKPEEMADPERGIFCMANKFTIGFTPVFNDSIRPMMINIENIGLRDISLLMKPQYQNNDSINGDKLYMYFARPFKTGEFTTDRFIPLVLLGSMWYDERFGIHRFCGEKIIDPDMTSDILKYLPHYYVIGIEVKPVKIL